jgi:hypothetical protein
VVTALLMLMLMLMLMLFTPGRPHAKMIWLLLSSDRDLFDMLLEFYGRRFCRS